MDFRKLADRAKSMIDRRGGTESVKEDVEELKDIASGEGTMKEKAKRAAEAVKEPGAPGAEQPSGTETPPPRAADSPPAPQTPPPSREGPPPS